jgi:hypothetical protein
MGAFRSTRPLRCIGSDRAPSHDSTRPTTIKPESKRSTSPLVSAAPQSPVDDLTCFGDKPMLLGTMVRKHDNQIFAVASCGRNDHRIEAEVCRSGSNFLCPPNVTVVRGRPSHPKPIQVLHGQRQSPANFYLYRMNNNLLGGRRIELTPVKRDFCKRPISLKACIQNGLMIRDHPSPAHRGGCQCIQAFARCSVHQALESSWLYIG